MNKPDSVGVSFVCMLPQVFLKPPKTSSVGSSWNDLPDDLKKKIIVSFSLASPTKSCEAILRLCRDAQCGEIEYKKLFLIQVNKLNWPPGLDWPAGPVRCDKTLAIPKNKSSWELAYNEQCIEFNEALTDVTEDGLALKYASIEMKNSREVVLAAVTQNGMALEFASPNLRENKEVVLVAVTQTQYATEFTTPELRRDSDIDSAWFNHVLNELV